MKNYTSNYYTTYFHKVDVNDSRYLFGTYVVPMTMLFDRYELDDYSLDELAVIRSTAEVFCRRSHDVDEYRAAVTLSPIFMNLDDYAMEWLMDIWHEHLEGAYTTDQIQWTDEDGMNHFDLSVMMRDYGIAEQLLDDYTLGEDEEDEEEADEDYTFCWNILRQYPLFAGYADSCIDDLLEAVYVQRN